MMTQENNYFPPIVFHPGAILSEKLEECRMPINEFSLRCQKPEKTIHAVLRGSSSITPDMAVLFENVLKIPARFWLKAQRDYDEFLARKRQSEIVEKSSGWAKLFPFSDMVKKGYIRKPDGKSQDEKTRILLDYFSVVSPEAWENYYQGQRLSTVFRLSLAGLENKHALSAWLRFGEIVAYKTKKDKEYSAEMLKSKIDDMVHLANSGSVDFKERLVKLCLEIGIVLVYTPHIKNSRAQGATRWYGMSPLVQISDCRKHYDIFWFSFFHEIGHILLHNKKDIFLEGIDYSEKNLEKENEADHFSAQLLVPATVERELPPLAKHYSQNNITRLSNQTGIHPAFLIGRMHHLGLISHAVGNSNIPQVTF